LILPEFAGKGKTGEMAEKLSVVMAQ